MKIQRILLGTDFSRTTSRAEEYARTLAKALGATVVVLHAIEPIEVVGDASDPLSDFLSKLQHRAEVQAAEVLARFKEDGVEAESRVVVEKRWRAIIEAAASGEFDMIVLGMHVIREDNKIYVGTTSHKVFFATNVPLLVVPSE